MRILVVEDSGRLQKYVARGLRQEGYAVDTTGNGDDALSLIKNPGTLEVTDPTSGEVVTLNTRVRVGGGQ